MASTTAGKVLNGTSYSAEFPPSTQSSIRSPSLTDDSKGDGDFVLGTLAGWLEGPMLEGGEEVLGRNITCTASRFIIFNCAKRIDSLGPETPAEETLLGSVTISFPPRMILRSWRWWPTCLHTALTKSSTVSLLNEQIILILKENINGSYIPEDSDQM